MLESATRRKRKRSITVEPSCIFDTSPSPSQRAYNLRSSRQHESTRTSRSPSCPPIAHIGAAASDEAAEKDNSSIAVEDDDGPLVDELASPKDSDPLTIEAFLQRSSAARTKTYRGRHKRRRVHFAEIDPEYAPPEDDADEAEDHSEKAVNIEPGDDDEPFSVLASSPPGSSVAAPPRKKKSLSHRLTMSALECGGTVPVEPEPPTTPHRIPLTLVAANGIAKPPKRPRKTGHLVDPRRRATFQRSILHFQAVAAQRVAAAASPSRSAAFLSARAAAAPSRPTAVAKPRYRPKWRTHAPPILPKAYFSSCAADSILPPPGRKPHRRQPAQVLDTIPLKLVPLKESVVGAKTKLATGRPGRRMTRKRDVLVAGPAPLTFVSVMTRNVPPASSIPPDTGRASSPAPAFCMTSVRDRLLASSGLPRTADAESSFVKAGDPELNSNTAAPDPIDTENPLYAGSSSPFSSNAATVPVPPSTAKNTLSSAAIQAFPSSLKPVLHSGAKPAPFSAFKTPLSFTSKTSMSTTTKTPLRLNTNRILPSTTQPTFPSNARTALPSSTKTYPSSTKPLKPLAAFHDRLAETVRTASQLVDAATGVLRTPSQRRGRMSMTSARCARTTAGRKSAVGSSSARNETSQRSNDDTSSTRLRMASTRQGKTRAYQPPITSMLASSVRGPRPSLSRSIGTPPISYLGRSPVHPRSRSPTEPRPQLPDELHIVSQNNAPAHSPITSLANSPHPSQPRSPHSSRPRPSHSSRPRPSRTPRRTEDQVCIDLCSSSPLLAAAARSALSSLPALSSSPAIDLGPPPAQATTPYSALPTTASLMSFPLFEPSQAGNSFPDDTSRSIREDAVTATQSHALPAIRKPPPPAHPATDPSSDSIQSSSPSFVMHSVRRLQSRSTTAREGLEVVWR